MNVSSCVKPMHRFFPTPLKMCKKVPLLSTIGITIVLWNSSFFWLQLLFRFIFSSSFFCFLFIFKLCILNFTQKSNAIIHFRSNLYSQIGQGHLKITKWFDGCCSFFLVHTFVEKKNVQVTFLSSVLRFYYGFFVGFVIVIVAILHLLQCSKIWMESASL